MRIALCLYGLIGSKTGKAYLKEGGTDEVLSECYDSFNKNLISQGNVDVFFHTWDVDFENQLVSKYQPKSYEVEPQIVFTNTIKGRYDRIQAHYSRWYSTQKVNNLKSKYESDNGFKYDMVVMSRFDMIWTTPIKIENYNPNIFYIPRTSKHDRPWGWPHGNNNEIGDLWFISSSENMDKFTTLYDKINIYMREGCPHWKDISNHMLAVYHLQKLSLLPNNVQLAFDDMKTKNGFGDFLIYRNYINLKKS